MRPPEKRLRERIAANGPIPFYDFMEEALYGDGGYYSREQVPIGKEGDFITGASLSPLFGGSTARLLRRLDGALGRPADYLEAGYGTGAHLRHLIDALGEGPRRRVLAWDRVRRPVPAGVEVHDDLEALVPGKVEGLIFSYELFDALAVHRLVGRPEGGLGELWIDLEGGEWVYRRGELAGAAVERLAAEMELELEPGQVADLSPDWRPLYRELAGRLEQGLLVTCDYGFERRQLLDPRVRRNGTLACYRSQQVHRDALRHPGGQDLSAHVDFTALREEGEHLGLQTVAFTRQAAWLTACGIFDELAEATPQERIDARTLLAPGGMGEEIRVLVQARGVAPDSLLDLALTGPHPSIQ